MEIVVISFDGSHNCERRVRKQSYMIADDSSTRRFKISKVNILSRGFLRVFEARTLTLCSRVISSHFKCTVELWPNATICIGSNISLE